MRYRDRGGATKFLNAHGVKCAPTGLACMASDAKGPKYSIVNGRALYIDADLLAWIAAEAAKPSLRQRRREKAAATTAGAVAS